MPDVKICPACYDRRLHTPEEWQEHHPYAGHGCTEGIWSHPDLQREADAQRRIPPA